MKKESSIWVLIFLMAILKFILPYFLQDPVYELHRDEFLYIEQGNHLAWGYMEVPPMLSWFARLSFLLGNSFFWIKFWPSFFGALALVITCRMVMELGGDLFAIFIASLCIIFTAYLRIHFLFQANFLEIFWWSLSAYFIIRYINTSNFSYLYLLGFAFGCGWLSKNSVSFFILSFLIGLLFTKQRTLFFNKHLYGAGLLSFIIALPNLIWQYNHKSPLLHHMKELRETQLKYINPADFLSGQLLMYLSCFFIWIIGLIWLFTKRGKQYRILAWMYLSLILILIITSGKNYYSIGAYPMMFAAGSVALQQWTSIKLKWIRWISVMIILFLAWLILPLALPIYEPEKLAAFFKKRNLEKTGMLKWEDQKNHSLPQDFADYLGWKELTEKAEKFYHSLPIEVRDSTVIFCRNYGQAGALKYYGRDQKFKEIVISDNGSFLQWIPDKFQFRHLIFIGRRMPDNDDELFQHFEKIIIVDSVTYVHSRQLGDKIIFFEKIDSVGLKLATDGLQQLKKQFNR